MTASQPPHPFRLRDALAMMASAGLLFACASPSSIRSLDSGRFIFQWMLYLVGSGTLGALSARWHRTKPLTGFCVGMTFGPLGLLLLSWSAGDDEPTIP